MLQKDRCKNSVYQHVNVTPIVKSRSLNLLAALMGKIVISQLTFNNICKQEAHLLSLFVRPD